MKRRAFFLKANTSFQPLYKAETRCFLICAAGADVERVILFIDADGTNVGGAERRDIEAGEAVGGFSVRVAVAVVGTSADESE